MAVTKTTTYYSTPSASSTNYGTLLKGLMTALISSGAVTWLSTTTDTSSSYDAYYRLNGTTNIKLRISNSNYFVRMYLYSDDETVYTSYNSGLLIYANTSYVIDWYKCANDMFNGLKITGTSDSSTYSATISWVTCNVFNDDNDKIVAWLGSIKDDLNIRYSLSTDLTSPICEREKSITNLESIWGDNTAVAVPVFLYDGSIPWKGVNDSYFYQTSIYPNTSFSEFKIGTTDMFYLGDQISVIA